MQGNLEFDNVSKSFGGVQALDRVSFSVKHGEFFSLLGPSGCGKTTLLRLVAGFEQPDSGRVLLDGQDISLLPPHKRPVNTVFQSYALFPHLNVWENIAFGLRVAKRPEKEIDEEVEKMLYLMQMEQHAYKNPNEISGGQKQRVAIARALINKPRLLLLDEPLAALDLKLRQKMLIEIDRIHTEVGITFLFVTHDQTEAMAVSNRIALLQNGRVEQIGSPVDLYEAPKTSFVAAFIGDTNFLDGKANTIVSPEYIQLSLEGLPDVLCFNDKQLKANDLLHLSVRPEKIHISREEPEPNPRHNIFCGVVEEIVYKGDHTKYWIRVGDYKLAVSKQHRRFLLDTQPIRCEETVWIWWHADDGYMLERYRESDSSLTELPPEKNSEDSSTDVAEDVDS